MGTMSDQRAWEQMKAGQGDKHAMDKVKSDNEVNRLRAKRQSARATPQQPAQATPKAPELKKPGVLKKAGTKLLNLAKTPVGKTIMGKAGVAGAVVSGFQAGEAIGNKLNENDAVNENFYRPITDKIAQWTGLEGEQAGMLSNDPVEAENAKANYAARTAPAQVPGQVEPAGPEQAPAEAGTTLEGGNDPSAVDADQAAAELEIYGESERAGPGLNAATPRPIEGSDYSYAGQYGDTDVLTRPDPRAEGATEFTDKWGAFGAERPTKGGARTAAEEEARGEAAREQYRRNTTMSDGRRAFGGGTSASTIGPDGKVVLGKSSGEQLRDAQQGVIDRGENTAVLDRQFAEEGRTPEQRAAYEADPVAAYANDAAASASASKQALDMFKYGQDERRHAATEARAQSSERRQGQEAADKQLTNAMASYELTAPRVHSAVMRQANLMYDNAQGQRSMSQILGELFSTMEMDGDLPKLDEQGNLMLGLQRPGNDPMDRVVMPHL